MPNLPRVPRFASRAARVALQLTLGLSGLAVVAPVYADTAALDTTAAPQELVVPAAQAAPALPTWLRITPFVVPAAGAAAPLAAPAAPAAPVAAIAPAGLVAPAVPFGLPALVEMPAEQAAAMERELLERVNADRAAHGLAPVAMDAELLSIARARATAQVTQLSLNHMDEKGLLAIQGLLKASGTSYELAGENLARLSAPEESVVALTEQALMNSPTHRKNILEPSFNRLAVGLVRDTRGKYIFAQIFRAV